MNATNDTNTVLHEHLRYVVQDENKVAELRSRAFVYLHDVRNEKPVVFQERMVENFDRSFLQALDQTDDTQLVLSYAVASIIAVKERLEAPETATAIIAIAELDLLR